MAKSNIEETKLYHVYMDFINYIEMITDKYPSNTKNAIVHEIKKDLYDGMRYILLAYKSFEKSEKLEYLNNCKIYLNSVDLFLFV